VLIVIEDEEMFMTRRLDIAPKTTEQRILLHAAMCHNCVCSLCN